jgi:predicted dienelactone hydrolase
MRPGTACIVVVLLAAAASAVFAGEATHNVGYTTYRFPVNDPAAKTDEIDVSVWYPTAAQAPVYTYSGPARIKGRVAEGAKPDSDGGPYPLIVYSHGYGGGALASIFLSEYLAKHGFIVAACDHSDAHLADRAAGLEDAEVNGSLLSAKEMARVRGSLGRPGFDRRPKELTSVIDGMLALNADEASPMGGMIDPERIGACGHSLGVHTVLMAGGMGDKDARIKALLVLSGGLSTFSPAQFRSLDLPIMFMYGEREGTEWRTRDSTYQRRCTKAAYDNCRPPKFMLEVKGAGHLSFCQALFSPRPFGSGSAAQAQADVIKKYALAFFARYLKGDRTADRTLTESDPMLIDLKFAQHVDRTVTH